MIGTDDVIKAIEEIESNVKRIKGRECIECDRLLVCPEKPQGVEYCLHFIKRGEKR